MSSGPDPDVFDGLRTWADHVGATLEQRNGLAWLTVLDAVTVVSQIEPDALDDVLDATRRVTDLVDERIDATGDDVVAVVLVATDAAPREWQDRCDSLGAHLIAFGHPYDRARLAALVTRGVNLPIARVDVELGVGSSVVLPHDLRLFVGEDPDFDMPPISLEGLHGDALRERKLQLARAYFGYLPGVTGDPDCPLHVELPETVLFHYVGPVLLEHRAVEVAHEPAGALSALRVGAGAFVTPGVFLTASTRVPTEAPPVEPQLVAVERGDLVITTQRIVFLGPTVTRQWDPFDLLGTRHEPLPDVDGVGGLLLRSPSYDRSSGVTVDDHLRTTIEFMVELARSDARGAREDLVLRLWGTTRSRE